MSQIDWSKAPEGAEVHFPDQAETAECFAIFREDGAYYAYPGMTAWTRWSGESKDSLLSRFKHSFKEWNGEGLPPVGTVCEHKRVHKWQRVEVFAVKPNYNGSHTALFTYENGCWAGCAEPSFFRPIRTPEQIAAEEREKELNRMVATASMLDKGWARKVCAGLYDAGYRKLETKES